jgi:hypothetical protein
VKNKKIHLLFNTLHFSIFFFFFYKKTRTSGCPQSGTTKLYVHCEACKYDLNNVYNLNPEAQHMSQNLWRVIEVTRLYWLFTLQDSKKYGLFF